jgi:hypothetical protein
VVGVLGSIRRDIIGPNSGPRLIQVSFGVGVRVGVTVLVSVGREVSVKVGVLVFVFCRLGVERKLCMRVSVCCAPNTDVDISEGAMLQEAIPKIRRLIGRKIRIRGKNSLLHLIFVSDCMHQYRFNP